MKNATKDDVLTGLGQGSDYARAMSYRHVADLTATAMGFTPGLRGDALKKREAFVSDISIKRQLRTLLDEGTVCLVTGRDLEGLWGNGWLESEEYYVLVDVLVAGRAALQSAKDAALREALLRQAQEATLSKYEAETLRRYADACSEIGIKP